MGHIPTERHHQGYLISADPARLDRAKIHAVLTESYWAKGVPRDVVDRSLDHSIAIGAYLAPDGPEQPAEPAEPDGPAGQSARMVQVGLVRAVTDRATFAWVCDVYVLPEHQGRGIAQAMMTDLRAHPELQGLRRWMLGTRDAHTLYTRFGFRSLDEVEQARYMVVRDTPYG